MKKNLTYYVFFTILLTSCTPAQNAKLEQDCTKGLVGVLLCPVGVAVSAVTVVAQGADKILLGTDPYTQTVQRQVPAFQRFGARTEKPITIPSYENGKTVQQIKEQRLILTKDQVLDKDNKLSQGVKEQILITKKDSNNSGGSIKLICPLNTPAQVMSELQISGIPYELRRDQISDYVLIMYSKA